MVQRGLRPSLGRRQDTPAPPWILPRVCLAFSAPVPHRLHRLQKQQPRRVHSSPWTPVIIKIAKVIESSVMFYLDAQQTPMLLIDRIVMVLGYAVMLMVQMPEGHLYC